MYGYTIIQAVHWSQQSLKLGPIFLLTLVVAANALVRRLAPRAALRGGELALIYIMILAATAIGGVGMVQFHVTGLPAPLYFLPTNPAWAKFLPFIPSFFGPRDPDVIEAFFKGQTSVYNWRILAEWTLPVLFWSGFLLLLFWTMLCINALIRRQWVDGERLTFPLVHLPLEMVREDAAEPFWKNRLMWAGLLLAGGLESLNSLNYLYPSVPAVWLKAGRVEHLITTPPWNGMGLIAIAFYPFMIGVVYLLTLDVSFSCWFFYALTKAELVLATALGWKDPVGGAALGVSPYLPEQSAGAFLGLALFALWTARGTLTAAVRDAVRGAPRREGEVMSYRTAWLGTLAGMAAVTALFTLCGLTWWMSLAIFLVYFLFQLTVTRIVAEAGAGWHYGPTCNAHELLFRGLGFQAFSPRDLTLLAHLNWIDMEYRDSPMPHQLEAMKLGAATGAGMRRVLWALLLAGVLGAFCAYWAELHIYYAYGAATAKVRSWPTVAGQAPFRQLTDWLAVSRPPNYASLGAVSGGFIATALLGVARQRFTWWPFHPLGYAMANTQSMDYMWMPFLLAWGIKAAVLRYGGMRLYRRLLPFFLGLILGDYVIPGLWFYLGWLTNTQMYMVFPH